MSEIDDQKLIEPRGDAPSSSDFVHALDSLADNVENVVANFQKSLLITLEKIEKLESLEESLKELSDRELTPNEETPYSEGIAQQKNEAANLAETSNEETSPKSSVTETTKSKTTNPSENHQSTHAVKDATDVLEGDTSKSIDLTKHLNRILQKISSKSRYLALFAVLAIFVITTVKIYFMIFP